MLTNSPPRQYRTRAEPVFAEGAGNDRPPPYDMFGPSVQEECGPPPPYQATEWKSRTCLLQTENKRGIVVAALVVFACGVTATLSILLKHP